MRDIPKTMHTTNTNELIRQIPWSDARAAEPEVLLAREWLVTNGLGGYAAGTVSGIPTRRYHGFLVAALPAPFGSISEIFDAEEPFTPRGCVAQAWSVAEVLRCWVKTSPQAAQQPADPTQRATRARESLPI